MGQWFVNGPTDECCAAVSFLGLAWGLFLFFTKRFLLCFDIDTSRFVMHFLADTG